jgi:hypothetical protein
MNRAERRKHDIKAKPKTYTLTDAQLMQIKNQAVEKALVLMLGLPVMVLHDKFGWQGDDRLQKFMDRVLELYDSFNQGYITLEDIIRTVEEETGVKLERK